MGNITQDIQRAYSTNVKTRITEDNDYSKEIKQTFKGLSDTVKVAMKEEAEASTTGSPKSSSGKPNLKSNLKPVADFLANEYGPIMENKDLTDSERIEITNRAVSNMLGAGYSPSEIKSVSDLMGININFKAAETIREERQNEALELAKQRQGLGASVNGPYATSAENEATGLRIELAQAREEAGIQLVANSEGEAKEIAVAQLIGPMEDSLSYALKQVTQEHFSYDQLVVAKNALKDSYIARGLSPDFVNRKIDLTFEGYEKFLQAKGEDVEAAAKNMDAINHFEESRSIRNFQSTIFNVGGEPITGTNLITSAKISPEIAKHLMINYEGGISAFAHQLTSNAATGGISNAMGLRNAMTDQDVINVVSEPFLQATRDSFDKGAKKVFHQGSMMAVDKLNERALQDIRDGKTDPMRAAHAATTAYENVIKYSTPEMLKEGQEDGSVGEMTARLLSTVAAASEKQEEGDLVLVNPVTYRTNAFRKISAGSGAGSVEGVSSPSGASNDRAVRTVKAIAKANSISFANAAKMYNRAMMLENDNFQDLIQAQGLESVEAIDAYLGRLMVSPTRFKAIDQEAAEADPVKSLMKTLPTKDGTKVTYGDLPDIGKAPAEEPTKAPVEEADEGTLKADEKAEILSSPVPSKEPSKVTDKEITWKLEKGTEVASPVSGKVEASVILRGEGVMLIRDAQGKLVALQGLGESMFQEGEEVEEGDILGIVDSSGVLKLSRSGKAKGKLFPVKLPFKLGKRA